MCIRDRCRTTPLSHSTLTPQGENISCKRCPASLLSSEKDSEASSSSSTKRPGIATTPGNPDWPCLDTVHCPDGRLKTVQKKDGNQFVVCDHNEFNNPSTCKVTLSLLKANRDFPHNCQLCLQDVGGSPSVGKATDEKDARGYTGEILPTTQQQ